MFVQSAHFVERHRKRPTDELSIYGQERATETVRLARMNLAVHGLTGQIREGSTYYEDLNDSVGAFDFVMANPPFNVDKVDKAKLEGDRRFPYGLPSADNANYLWIQVFASALNETGRAGFVMANSAGDARHSEAEVRRKLIEDHMIDVVVAIGPNFFYTVTLPCMLWFLDRGKRGTEREDKVLFLDAREIFRQIDRAHRDFTDAQIELLANIVRVYRGEKPEHQHEPDPRWEPFVGDEYVDVPGLCMVATTDEIEAQGWSLNPGRYVGAADVDEHEDDFSERLQALYDEFIELAERAASLQSGIRQSIEGLLS